MNEAVFGRYSGYYDLLYRDKDYAAEVTYVLRLLRQSVPAVLSERPSVRVKRVEDEATRLTRLAEPELDAKAGVVTVRFTMLAESKKSGRLTTFTEEHRLRYLFPTEIHALAEQSGFAVERMEEYLSGKKPSLHTWGVAYLLPQARLNP